MQKQNPRQPAGPESPLPRAQVEQALAESQHLQADQVRLPEAARRRILRQVLAQGKGGAGGKSR